MASIDDEIDQFICEVTTRKSHRMDANFTAYIKNTILPIIVANGAKLPAYVVIQGVAQNRGRASWSHDNMRRRVTIPTWIQKKELTYQVWYVAHELAHFANYDEFGKNQDMHGPNFMRHLKRICPLNAVHHELGYKPRNASAAGISQDLGDL